MQKRWVGIIANIFLIIYFSLFFAQKISLPTADLGRHITNGKIFIQTGKVVSTNYYSYTEPDFLVVNHHWFSGVIFYIVQKVAGFSGLSVFYILISGATVYFFYKIAKLKSSFGEAFLITLFLIPLMANRKEIRPEGFSYFFIGLYFYLLTLFNDKKIKTKLLYAIILVSQLIWVNTHIFFIMGNFIILVFLFNEALKKWIFKKNNNFKQLLILSIFSFVFSLLNPYGIKGLLEPFNIFKEYGYMIIENQSVFFMQKRTPNFTYFYFEMLTIISFVSYIILASAKNIKNNIHVIIFSIIYLILSYKAIRIIPIFALFDAVILAIVFSKYFKIKESILIYACMFFVIVTFIPGHYFSIFKNNFGIGLRDNVNKSGEFFIQNNIKGPIFNNYDIGGYLIYYLDGKEKVFVDNRPEAYSVEFFTKTYVPMQENEQTWKEMDQKYNFNAIYFYRHDATPWAQPFLIQRIEDSGWMPVFVDDYTLILVKNNEQNKDIIDKYRLPKSMFRRT